MQAVMGAAAHSATGLAVRDTVDRTLSALGHAATGKEQNVTVGSALQAIADAVERSIASKLRSMTHSAVASGLDCAVDATVRRAVEGEVMDVVETAVFGRVASTLTRVLARDLDMVNAPVRAALMDPGRSCLGGQFWAPWVAYERFFADVCGLELPDTYSQRGKALARLVKSCGWVWTHKQFAIATDRPMAISLQNGRLHDPQGPAIEFRDRWGFYALQGVVVPSDWIEHKDKLDPTLALTHPNVEQRRVLREWLGWQRVLDAVGGVRVVDEDRDPEIGSLLEVELRDEDEDARFLRMRCGTGRTLIERVHPGCRTALEAQEWRLGLNPGEYAPEERT